jgi:hypothetical protein
VDDAHAAATSTSQVEAVGYTISSRLLAEVLHIPEQQQQQQLI